MRCEPRRTFAVRTASSTITFTQIHKSTDNLNWPIGSYSHFRDMNIELMSCQKIRRHIKFAPAATDALQKLCFAM